MKLILLILGMVLMAGMVHAAPFLVCSPYPPTETQPTYFLVWMDGGSMVNSPAVTDPGGVILKYDVGAVSAGNHSVIVQACLNDPVWGEACSESSAPFAFSRPSVPVKAGNFKLSK